MFKKESLSVVERMQAPTPRFFRVLRTVGLSLAATGGAILAIPTMPVALVSIAGYLAVAGGVMSAVSQAAVEIEQADELAKVEKKD